MSTPVQLYISYSHEDDRFHAELERHLAALKRRGTVSTWTDRAVQAGEEWARQAAKKLEDADIVLLLVSASFLGSDYLHGREVERAMERHEAGDARVIPVILRPCAWENAAFAKLQALPKDGRPLSLWRDRDEAWLDVVQGISRVAESMSRREVKQVRSPPPPGGSSMLDPRTQLQVAEALRRVMQAARVPMEVAAAELNMDTGRLADDDWLGLVRAVHAGMHRESGDGKWAVRRLVESALAFVPANTELRGLLSGPLA